MNTLGKGQQGRSNYQIFLFIFPKEVLLNICKYESCGKEFEGPKNRKFCSDKCREKGRRKVECCCLNCNVVFYRRKSNRENKFCGKKCQIEFKYNKKNLKISICAICGNEFYKKHKNHVCCSVKCSYINSKKTEQYEYTCENCGIFFYTHYKKKGKHYFCSHKCSELFSVKRKTNICKICGREFENIMHEKRITCSAECKAKYQSITFVGKNSNTYKHEISDEERHVKCKKCGKTFYCKPRGKLKKKPIFCSKKCAMSNSIKSLTKPHAKVCDILLRKEIEFEIEYRIDRYFMDIFIPNNKIIEVMGTYWHCDIRNYGAPKNDKQEKNILKDRIKKTIVLEKTGVNILYLWEEDINKNPGLCEMIIDKYMENDGILQNYHSINYCVKEDGVLNLNENVLVPFFEI